MTGTGQTYVVVQEGNNLSFVPAEMVQGDLQAAVNGGQVRRFIKKLLLFSLNATFIYPHFCFVCVLPLLGRTLSLSSLGSSFVFYSNMQLASFVDSALVWPWRRKGMAL